jgi:hypothetical protein
MLNNQIVISSKNAVSGDAAFFLLQSKEILSKIASTDSSQIKIKFAAQ